MWVVSWSALSAFLFVILIHQFYFLTRDTSSNGSETSSQSEIEDKLSKVRLHYQDKIKALSDEKEKEERELKTKYHDIVSCTLITQFL